MRRIGPVIAESMEKPGNVNRNVRAALLYTIWPRAFEIIGSSDPLTRNVRQFAGLGHILMAPFMRDPKDRFKGSHHPTNLIYVY